jgi:hypothetical protein
MLKKILFMILIVISGISKKILPINNNDAYNFYKKYIDENSMENILSYIYKKQPSFFLEDPSPYFPLHSENIEDFIYAIEPLINFFEPLLWGNIVFPISISPLADNFDAVLNQSDISDVDKIQSSDVILLKGGTYPAMKKQLLFVNQIITKFQQNIPLFLVARSSRLNTNLYYESFDYIAEDIQSTINRALTEEDLAFIASNLNNEYGLALIINRFFNSQNLTILDLECDDFLSNFNDYLYSINYYNGNVLFISNNIFTLYHELKYAINALDNPEVIDPNYPLTFGGKDIPLKDSLNPEGIFLRKLKMITLLLNLIVNNIDN